MDLSNQQSRHAPVGEDGDATLADLIKAPDAVDPHAAAEASALQLGFDDGWKRFNLRGRIFKPIVLATPCTTLWRPYSRSLCISKCGDEPKDCCGMRLTLVIYHSTSTLAYSVRSFGAPVAAPPTTRPSANGHGRCAMSLDARSPGTRLKSFMKAAGGVNAWANRYANLKRRS